MMRPCAARLRSCRTCCGLWNKETNFVLGALYFGVPGTNREVLYSKFKRSKYKDHKTTYRAKNIMALSLNNIHPTRGSVHKKKRVGRGPGSGLGKTAGRGEKGQKSRSGYSAKIGFEGGQMPLHRRLPKRGFTNIFKKRWLEVSLAALERGFQADEEVTPELLHDRGIIKKAKHDVVVLGNGELSKPLRISAHRFTKSAREKIEKAGGAVSVIE